ncbi:hypothetical protein H0H92_006146 [Tricholoma furcatifolium]|nr:hypothetical protein H0H92_006146 [Tricholoma furcatifolium]
MNAIVDAHRQPNPSSSCDSLVSSSNLIPDEVLAIIIGFGVFEFRDTHDTFEFRTVVSQINRQWRECILRRPEFWSVLDISLERPVRQTLHLLSLSLARSQDQPLDITLDLTTSRPDQERWAVLYAVGSHSARWRRIKAYIPGDAPSLNVFAFYDAPNLVDLHLSAPVAINDPSSFFLKAPMRNISKLTLVRTNLAYTTINFVHLKVLKIYSTIFGPQFFDSLSAMTSLEHLDILIFSPILSLLCEAKEHVPPVQRLQTLRSFRVVARGPIPRLSLEKWATEHLPSIEELEESHIQRLLPQAQPSFPIVNFELFDISPHSSLEIPLETIFPCLTELILHKVVADDVLTSLIVPPGECVPCPHLRSITIVCAPRVNGVVFWKVLQTRRAAEHPIQELRVDALFFNQPALKRERLEANVEHIVDAGVCSIHKRR